MNQQQIVLLALILVLCDFAQARSTSRYQRQVMTGQWYSGGLSGTGTSFNAWNSYDPYKYQPQQQQQNQLNDPYDDIVPTPVLNTKHPFNRYDNQVNQAPDWRGFGSKKGRGKMQGSHVAYGTKGA